MEQLKKTYGNHRLHVAVLSIIRVQAFLIFKGWAYRKTSASFHNYLSSNNYEIFLDLELTPGDRLM